MKANQIFLAVLLAGVCLTGAFDADAHDGATGVVKERMEHMKVMGASMKGLVPYVNGSMPFDADEVAGLARKIHERGGQSLVELFPQNSLSEHSEAKQDIWQNWGRFEALAHELKANAETLARTAATQEQAVQTGFIQISQTCKACHTEFRTKKN